LQWGVVLAFLVFVGHALFQRHPRPEYEPASWHDWEGVTVLSYAGISHRNEALYPTVTRLAEHLHALRGAGYRTVRPEDVRAFLDGRAPLPRKALLLIFEEGRKEATLRATPLLQQTGFSAVIAVPTARADTRGGFYLKQSDIKRLGRIPSWQLGSMGHEAYMDIPVDAHAATGRFLTRRKWLDTAPEDAESYQSRVLRDYARSAKWLQAAGGKPASLYLYPYADAGQSPDADPLAESVNRNGVTQHYGLAFVRGDDPYNGVGSDPWTLSRLRVRGDWDAEELLRQLALNRPRPEGQPALGDTPDWLLERDGRFEEGRLVLPSGAAAWLRGSDDWSDLDLHATLTAGSGGVASLYARYAGPRSWLRISLATDGLRVQERLHERIQTLHFLALPREDPARAVRLRLLVRHNRAWVWQDDEAVASQHPLAPATRRGRVGVSAETDSMILHAFKADLLPPRLVLANSIRLIPDTRHSQLRAILPVWFRASERPRIAETHRKDLMLAAVSGTETIPVITGATNLAPAAATDLARQIEARIQELGLESLILTLGLEGPADALASALRDRGFRLVHLLDAEQAEHRGPSLAGQDNLDWIVITTPGEKGEAAFKRLLYHMPARRLALCDAADSVFGPGIQTAHLAGHARGKEERE